MLRILTIVALMAVAASASRGGPATLAPALDSFLERGAQNDAELTAVAEALLDKADEQVESEVGVGAETVAVETGATAHSDADLDADVESAAGSDSESEADAEAEAEAEAEAVSDLDAEAEAEVDREIDDPLRTKNADTLTAAQLKARRRARRMRRLRRRIAGQPKPLTAQEKATAAAAEQADRDGIVRMVFDELKRLGASGSVVPGAAGAPNAPPSPLGVSDPRIRSLESRLSMFEQKRARAANAVQDRAIASINARLEGLDKTLNALKQSALQQQKLTDQLMSAVAVARGGAQVDARPDFTVEYARAELPGDFEARVEEILDSVKAQARQIYERSCKRRPKPAPDTDPAATPRKYPSEKTPPAPLPPAKGAASKKDSVANIVAAAKKAQSKASKKKATKKAAEHAAAAEAAVLSAGGAVPNEENPIAESEVVPKPILFAPIVKGKEPTPEGLRLAKALNDVNKALPLTPAYLLGAKERALHDVLGEDAVGKRWKSSR